MLRGAYLNRLDNDSNVNLNDRFNNDNAHVSEIAPLAFMLMQRPKSLYDALCSYDNLYLAYKKAINEFLKENLKVELHPDKSKILCLRNGINFLGFRIFYYHKLLKKSNVRKMNNKYPKLKDQHFTGNVIYDEIYDFLEGWIAYAKHANTYKLRKRIFKEIRKVFLGEISTKEINRYTKCSAKGF